MKTFQITSLDSEGNVVASEQTKEEWSISEIEYHLEEMKSQLHRGEIEHIIIDRIS